MTEKMLTEEVGMTEKVLTEIRQVCVEIAEDMFRYAHEFEGKPFDGRTVGEYFGNHGAAIAVLAKMVVALATEVKDSHD